MAFEWIHEDPAYWDAGKNSVVGGEPAGTFHLPDLKSGDLVPGDWWRVEDSGRVLAYGWMDVNWGDAEVLLAVAAGARGRGVGTFVLDRLEDEARARGLNYLSNVVRATHPRAAEVSRWLQARRFRTAEDGALRRAVARG